jgi:hypothetical protein
MFAINGMRIDQPFLLRVFDQLPDYQRRQDARRLQPIPARTHRGVGVTELLPIFDEADAARAHIYQPHASNWQEK